MAMVLLRTLLGDVLRQLRLRQRRTLREVSGAARVSLGYLSEVERGQKEASSELLAAICRALEVPLSTVLREVADQMSLAELAAAELAPAEREPAMAGAGAGPAREQLNRRLEKVGHDGSVLEASMLAQIQAVEAAERTPFKVPSPEHFSAEAFRNEMVSV